MKNRDRTVRLLFGSNRQGGLIATAIGCLFGIVALLMEPVLGITYWPWPTSVLEWGFVVGCILLPASVALYRLGLVVAWWMNFPAHIAFAYHVFHDNQIVALPFQDDLLSYAVIAAQIAVAYGLIGYVLGTVGRAIRDLGDETGIPTRP